MTKQSSSRVKASLLCQNGNYAYNTGDFKSALKKYTASIKLFPNDEVYYHRGLTYQALKKIKEAMKDFDIASKLGIKQAFEYLKKLSK